MLIDLDEMVSEDKFANRTEAIIQAITEFLSSEKNSIRAFPTKMKEPSLFSEHVKKVKNDLRRAKI
jgi:Arc/MetJ-type ribon-helix-helix transcriptional regulator